MSQGWKTVIKLIASVLILLVIGALVLSFIQRRLLFPRHFTQALPEAGQGIEGLEKLWLTTGQGKVEGWLIPGDGVSEQSPGPAVIFTHGNAELIEYWPEELSGYREMGISLLLPEYRGYGRSGGSPSQEVITKDLTAFYDLLLKRPEIDPESIVFHGRSIGGGAACALATVRTPKVLILQSTFVSVKEMAARYYLPGFLVSDPFDNLAVVSNLKVPLLVIHGRLDELVPFEHGQRLAQAASNGRLIAYDCDHNSCPPDPRRFWQDIREFLQSTGIISQQPLK